VPRFRTSEVAGPGTSAAANMAEVVQPPVGARQRPEPCHHVTLMASTGDSRDRHLWSLHEEAGSGE